MDGLVRITALEAFFTEMLSQTARDYKHKNPSTSSGFTISLEVYGQLILHLMSNSLPQDAMPGAQSDGRQTTLLTQLLPKLNARPTMMSATEYCRPQTKVHNMRPINISSYLCVEKSSTISHQVLILTRA